MLLATTKLSGGHPWLDCVVSWALLVTYAGVVMAIAKDSFPCATGRNAAFGLLIAFFALYPGHLANLQWGWQVAVFLCLVGVIATIRCLTRDKMSWRHQALALAFAALACCSFAVGIALIPTALVLVALRTDASWMRRAAFAAPWLAAGILIAVLYPATPNATAAGHFVQIVHYALNFLGGGISRFAPFLAPWLALIGLASGLAAFATVRREQASHAWLGFFLFAIAAAVLVATDRAAAFGAEHAFVTRYVSFSSLFWLGWLGLVGMTARTAPRPWASLRIPLTVVIAVLALGNAYQMMNKAARIGAETRATAKTIRATWPQVDPAVLAEIYFDQPDIAQERLEMLHELGFAPFDER